MCSWYVKTGKLQDVLGLVCGGQKDELDYHHVVFDEQTLTTGLVDAGFQSVCKWDWRDTTHRDVDDYSQAYLPHMDKTHGLLMSLNLQAQKPV